MKHYISIGVDYQQDFKEGGALAVEGGQKAVEAYLRLIEHKVPSDYSADENSASPEDKTAHYKSFIKEAILTKDSHPYNHCSFKFINPEGLWPWHCVEHTEGAAICDPIIKTLAMNGIPYGVVGKGQNPNEENYTAFRFVFVNDYMYTYSLAPDFNPTGNVLDFLRDPDDVEENFNEIIISGIAGDYCVLETVKAMIDMDPIIYLPGVASIDGGKALNDYIEEHHLRIMDENFNIVRSTSGVEVLE